MVKPYWVKLGLAMVCMVFVSLLTAAQAFLVQPALDDVFLKKDKVMLFLLPLRSFYSSSSKGFSTMAKPI